MPESATTPSSPPDPNGYLSYYGLHAAPFRTSADPRLLWLGEKRREVLETLTAGIRRGDGIVLLTGDIGAGKTSLANGVGETLRSEGLVTGKVLDSGFETSEFFQAVAHAYAIGGDFPTRDAFVARFRPLLAKPGSNHKRALLIIDEAQSLSHDLLGEIRDLSIAGSAEGLPLSILLVGQKELEATLAEHHVLRQRIVTRCRLDLLTPDEVGEYIRYCLKIAGSEHETFSAEAVHDIAMLSRGAPGVINTVCTLALVTGYGRKARTIDRQILEDCRKRMGAPSPIVTNEIRLPVRPRSMVRGAVEGSARPPRERSGAGRGVLVPVSVLAALLAIGIGYGVYAGSFTRIRHDLAPSGPDRRIDTADEPRVPKNVPNRSGAQADEPVDATGSPAGSPAPSPGRGAVPAFTERAARPRAIPATPTPAPEASVGETRPKDIPPRASAAPLPPARDASGQPGASGAPARKAPVSEGARDASGQPGASGAPARKAPVSEGQTESPDPAGVIDWLLEEHKGPKR